MADLLVKPDLSNPRIQHITPENASWRYVGFDLYRLSPGDSVSQDSNDQEICLVILSGQADIQTRTGHWQAIGERRHVFEQMAPYSVYLPNDDHFSVTALSDVELAVCKAPGKGNHRARLIRPEDCSREQRGRGTNTRHICNILPENEAADSLLVVEVITPNGHWSSYPPHKHDKLDLPHESMLEETYYHQINPGQGYALQRVYTDDRTLDEAMVVEHHDVVKVPYGYHPVAAAHGYDLYYLNVMAGPQRIWRFHNDPDHEWIISE